MVCHQILAVELQGLKKVAPRVSPTAGMHHLLTSEFAITGVAVGLQDAVKVRQELPRAVCATIQLKIEYDRCARATPGLPGKGASRLALRFNTAA
jgi:hypothetical protein